MQHPIFFALCFLFCYSQAILGQTVTYDTGMAPQRSSREMVRSSHKSALRLIRKLKGGSRLYSAESPDESHHVVLLKRVKISKLDTIDRFDWLDDISFEHDFANHAVYSIFERRSGIDRYGIVFDKRNAKVIVRDSDFHGVSLDKPEGEAIIFRDKSDLRVMDLETNTMESYQVDSNWSHVWDIKVDPRHVIVRYTRSGDIDDEKHVTKLILDRPKRENK